MKKILFGTLFLSIISCTTDTIDDTVSPPSVGAKIQTFTTKDESVDNGNITLYERYDYKFEYNQDKLTKVWDINGNYTENLIYDNNLVSRIDIVGNRFIDIGVTSPFSLSRKLSYDSNQRIIKTQPLSNNVPVENNYVTFEYPSSDIIIAKGYGQNPFNNQIALQYTLKMYIANENVVKIEQYQNSVLLYITNYEYDQKISPNYNTDKNIILGLPGYSFNIFPLQDYSQISKNNVISKKRYGVEPGVGNNLMESVEVAYTYQSNNLPATVIYHYPGDPNSYTSGDFGF